MVGLEEYESSQVSLLEHFLRIVRQHLPTVNRAIEDYGETTLSSYLQNFIHDPRPSLQRKDDLFDVLKRLAEPLLGKTVVNQAIRDLSVCPVLLTANHNGVNSIPQSFQASLIFSLNALQGALSIKTVCIFSCGNIPLNNYEYPRGLLLYHLHPARDRLNIKFPIFPDRLKRRMVSVTPGFDQAMIKRAELSLERMLGDGRLPQHIAGTLRNLLREEYADPSVLALKTYSEQSAVLNHRIWRRVFDDSVAVPYMVNVEIERMVAALLEVDLLNAESLAWCAMFDPALRQNVLQDLDGKRGCWQLEKLAARLESFENGQAGPQGCGTVFFWGVDDLGRRIPLHLTADGSSGEALCGIDDQGSLFRVPLTPAALIESLQSRRLLPSLYTCFLVLSFARGFVCVGGYFQGGYLPVMQTGLVRALDRTAGYKVMSRFVAQVPTDRYLSGVAAVMTRADDNHLIPAGPVEILAGGGMGGRDIEQMLLLTVREAHLAGMFETAPEVLPEYLRPPGWEKQLAKECRVLLSDKVVVK